MCNCSLFVFEANMQQVSSVPGVSPQTLQSWTMYCGLIAFLTWCDCLLNSTRKRQSVICRYPDGKLVLYCKVRMAPKVLVSICFWTLLHILWVYSSPRLFCESAWWTLEGWVFSTICLQGADTVIYERMADGGVNKYKEVTRDHLEKYGADGLRTLCLAYRNLDPQQYESWNEKYIQAKSALRDREKKLDEVYVM